MRVWVYFSNRQREIMTPCGMGVADLCLMLLLALGIFLSIACTEILSQYLIFE